MKYFPIHELYHVSDFGPSAVTACCLVADKYGVERVDWTVLDS